MKKLSVLFAFILSMNFVMAQKMDRTNAFMYNKNGQFEKAIESIEKCVNHDQFGGWKTTDRAQAWMYRGIIYLNVSQDAKLKGKYPDALDKSLESFTKCIEVDQDFAQENMGDIFPRMAALQTGYYQKGAENFNASNFTVAADAFMNAFGISTMMPSPDTISLLYAASAYTRSQNYDTALICYESLKQIGYDKADLYKNLIELYNQKGDNEKAAASLTEGLAKYPNDGNLIIQRVNTLLKEGKGSEAIIDLEKLVAMDPNNHTYLFALGNIYGNEDNKELYNPEKAAEYYEKTLQIKPDFTDATYDLGALYVAQASKLQTEANNLPLDATKEYEAKLKEVDELLQKALPYIKTVHEAQPDDVAVRKVLRNIYTNLKMYDEAKALNN